MHSRIRRTALPALAFAVATGMVGMAAPAVAGTHATTSTVASTSTGSAASAAAAARPKVKAPAKITVHEFGNGKVTVSWSRVKGVKRYEVHAYKIDPKVPGPYPFNLVPGSNYRTTTTRLSNTFVNNFTPRTDASRLNKLPWIITVASLSPDRNHRNSSAHSPNLRIKDRIVYSTVVVVQRPSAKQLRKEKSVVADCAVKGLAAGLGTAGAGGLVALASIWIPGVNVVTWTGVAVTSAAAGISTTFVCVLVNKINPDGAIVHVGHSPYALAV